MDKTFINALECSFIEGVDFGRRDIKILNEIYDYSKGAVDGKFKHPHKGIKMDGTTEDIVGIQTVALLVTLWIFCGHPGHNKHASYLLEFHVSITLAVI